MTERGLPPITQLGMASLALLVAGGIYLAARLPNDEPLTPAIIAVAGSALLLALSLALLARTAGFAWGRFVDVGGRALLAYAVIAGMIEYAFLRNDLSGGALTVLTLSLAVFAVQVPILIAFTVARYEPPGDANASRAGDPGRPSEGRAARSAEPLSASRGSGP